MPLNPLNHHYAMENPASVYDEEAMTALELAGRTTAKMNETVQAFNELEAETNQHLENQDQAITKMNNVTMPNKVVSEVQRRIDDGTFERQIEAHMGNLEARVDNLLANTPEGGTTMDAEVIDTRVDMMGNTHTNAGSAVRYQASRAIYEANRRYYYNRLNPDKASLNTYIRSGNPEPGYNEEYFATDFIHVTPGEKLVIHTENHTQQILRFVCFYDSKKQVLPNILETSMLITIPENCYYIRVTLTKGTRTPSDFCIIEQEYGHYLPYGKMVEKTDTLSPEYDVKSAYYYNRIIPDRCIPGNYPSHEDGTMFYSPLYACTNFIMVNPGETLVQFNTDMTTKTIRMLAVYDTEGVFIPELSGEYMSTFTNSTDKPLYIRATVGLENYNGGIMIAEPDCPVFLAPGKFVLKATETLSKTKATCTKKSDTLASGGNLNLDAFPRHIRKNVSVIFKCEFNSFTKVSIGHGGSGVYSAMWLEIDATSIKVKTYYTGEETEKTIAHGLNITGALTCVLSYKGRNGYISLITNGGAYHSELGACDPCGEVFASVGQASSNAILTATSEDLLKPVWLIGDSYFGFSGERVIGNLEQIGFDNYMLLAQPGLSSAGAHVDLTRALLYHTPEIIVWYLGMNDSSASAFEPYFNSVVSMCKERNITLVANKVPTVPDRDKAGINAIVESSGVRYIDSYGAVGASSSGWRAGMLASDNVHPTALGAQVLASQMLVDVPEIMTYGRK